MGLPQPHSDTVASLTAFQRDILRGIVRADTHRNAEAAPSGLGVKQWLEGVYGEEVNHGRLYPNLDSLIDAGLVERSEIDKRTNGYELTDAGAGVVQELKHRYTDAYNLHVEDDNE